MRKTVKRVGYIWADDPQDDMTPEKKKTFKSFILQKKPRQIRSVTTFCP